MSAADAPLDLDAVEAAARAVPWQAGPWSARTFGVDCPCDPDCGCAHDCCEVNSSPDEYPGAQVVAQIVTPGLGSLAEPVAQYIALMWPGTTLSLVSEAARLRTRLAALDAYRLACEAYATAHADWRVAVTHVAHGVAGAVVDAQALGARADELGEVVATARAALLAAGGTP